MTDNSSSRPTHNPSSIPAAELAATRNSRRRFLGAIGAGVGAAVVAPAVVSAQVDDDERQGRGDRGRGGRAGRGRPRRDGRGDAEQRETADRDAVDSDGAPQRFSRLFNLPSFAEPGQELREALIECGRPGGMMDANDPLEVGPIRLITEPELSPDNRDNPTHTAGITFLGQFMDHDITRDAGSRLGRPTSLRRSTNLRSARMDLDSVYGGGPDDSPGMYDGFRFRVESGGAFEDVPRDDEGIAMLGDDRNDENMMISGIQAAFLMFHNAVLDDIVSGTPTQADFDQARQIVQWHYQWIVVHEALPQFVGQEMVDDIVANGRKVYTATTAQIPVEFQTAAYRFGHSMIRPSYRANLAGDNGEPFFAFVFNPDTFGQQNPDDLTGRSRAERRFIGWQTFFDFEDGEVKPNKRIDTKMSTPLFQLPIFTLPNDRGEDLGPTSLATRNLLRHITWEIPSGQDVARTMGVDPLSAADLSDLGQLGAGLDTSTPLFFYLLREADVMADGLHLGPTGGRIVAEVLLGLLGLDDTSYVNVAGGWSPTLPQRSGSVGDDFTMADLLTIAGVDPASRGQ
jgi:hypothetical protein